MLHELLLVLSAHESSIFRPWPPAPAPPETLVLDSSFANIHPSERVILNNLAKLSFLHKQLRQSISALIHGHSSIVIRAVVSCANDSLHGFQLALEQVEKLILTRDDSVVGAFDIVPLSRLSALLGEWDRTIEYLHKFVSHIKSDSNGAQVLNRLHQDQHTGYPDIEAIVIKLIAAGEEAWLRQVSSWVLYGHVPLLGKSDFFVRQSTDPNVSSLDENAFTIDWTLWPDHLPREIASSILFIGRSLARIQSHSTIRQISNRQILKEHLSLLNTVTFPLVPLALSKCINSIRLSLSSSVLSSLLPLDTVIRYVKRFRQDFLLGHGSLMLTLLNVTESYLLNRADHDGGTIKEADVNNLLAKSWSIVSRYESAQEEEQEGEESKSYQHSLKLSLVKTPRTRNAQPPEVQHDTAFDDLLLGERIELKYEILWPLDLFLSRHDVEVYNKIFNFLLAVKKAQGQLTSIWPGRNFPYVSRRSWACLNYMLFFIDSLWSYFQVVFVPNQLTYRLLSLNLVFMSSFRNWRRISLVIRKDMILNPYDHHIRRISIIYWKDCFSHPMRSCCRDC